MNTEATVFPIEPKTVPARCGLGPEGDPRAEALAAASFDAASGSPVVCFVFIGYLQVGF